MSRNDSEDNEQNPNYETGHLFAYNMVNRNYVTSTRTLELIRFKLEKELNPSRFLEQKYTDKPIDKTEYDQWNQNITNKHDGTRRLYSENSDVESINSDKDFDNESQDEFEKDFKEIKDEPESPTLVQAYDDSKDQDESNHEHIHGKASAKDSEKVKND